jgi:hypothetical protein
MARTQDEDCRIETLTAALIYLMSHYARTGCPRLAVCVSRHMQSICVHPDASPVLRDICAALHGPWLEAAGAPEAQASPLH